MIVRKISSRVALTILTVFSVIQSKAQCDSLCGPNLTTNPGFEQTTQFCGVFSELSITQSPVVGWFGPEIAANSFISTSDYMSSPCAPPPGLGLPSWYTENCGDGVASGGIAVFLSTDTETNEYREYLINELTDTLEAGQQYCFSMKVKTADAVYGRPSDGIGIWFSDHLIDLAVENGGESFMGQGSIINATPYWDNVGNVIGTDSCMVLTGTVTAVTGTEKYMYLGNFRHTSQTTTDPTTSVNQLRDGYFTVDEVYLQASCINMLTVNDTSVCLGECVEVKPSENNLSAYSFDWGAGFTTDSLTTFCPLSDTTITLTYRDNQTGITATTTFSISILLPSSISLGNDVTTCNGDTVLLQSNGVYDSYMWSTGSNDSSIQVTTTGTYSLTVTENQCATTDEINVTFKQPPSDLQASVSICFFEIPSITLDAASAPDNTYIWSTGDSTQRIEVEEPGRYTVTIIDATDSCQQTYTVEVINSCINSIYVPNAFTPNGDGINDLWFPVKKDFVEEVEILIFNRFGELIFQSDDLNTPWDGTSQSSNEIVQIGVYPYVIRLRYATENGRVGTFQEFRGHVTVIR